MYFTLSLLIAIQSLQDVRALFKSADLSICAMIREELLEAADRGEITYGEAADIYHKCRKSDFD